jgi:hypothetical protein
MPYFPEYLLIVPTRETRPVGIRFTKPSRVATSGSKSRGNKLSTQKRGNKTTDDGPWPPNKLVR